MLQRTLAIVKPDGVMKGVAGIFTDRQRSVSISAWYQASLSAAAVSKSFDYGVGMGVSYFFDW
jgi:nucleoside diphosphate kinase